MLHYQADCRNGNPAAETHKYRLAAFFNKADDVCVQADGTHCHSNKELGQPFGAVNKVGAVSSSKGRLRKQGNESSDKRGCYKVKYKPWENLRKRDFRTIRCTIISFFAERVLIKASTSVIGIIASVLVSFTVVA